MDGILHNASQDTVYGECVQDVVSSVLDGYNGTVFAYGQTGAGKTYTMCGDTGAYQQRGTVPRALHQIFSESDARVDRDVTVKVSYLEIYNEVLYDLLADGGEGLESVLNITDHGGVTDIKGLSKVEVANEQEALALFFAGENVRSTVAHTLNKSSSRSHCIFTVHIETRYGGDANEKATASKLHCVDLAGSERTKKTQVTGQSMKEAMFINKSLSFLEQTVNALAKKDSHVPYRQTKLTSVLKDALGGNCKTVMIGNIWGEDVHMEETISTLRFASRVRTIETHAVVNESRDPAILIRRYERQISELKQELAMRDTFSGRGKISYDEFGDAEKYEIQVKCQKFLDGELSIDDIPIHSLRQDKETYMQFKDIFKAKVAELEAHGPKPSAGAPATAAAEAAAEESVNDENLVGEIDPDSGAGFHVGQAPDKAKPAEISQDSPDARAAPLSQRGGRSPQKGGPPAAGGGLSEKSLAYEAYKHSVAEGNELYLALKEKQQALKAVKQEMKDIAKGLSEKKGEIDELTQTIKARKEDPPTEEGPAEVFELKTELKQMKMTFRAESDRLTALKPGLRPLQIDAHQAKERLIEAFEEWHANHPLEEDPELDAAEQFEQVELQHMMLEDPDSVAFFMAKKSTKTPKKSRNSQNKLDEKSKGSMARKKEKEAALNFGLARPGGAV